MNIFIEYKRDDMLCLDNWGWGGGCSTCHCQCITDTTLPSNIYSKQEHLYSSGIFLQKYPGLEAHQGCNPGRLSLVL